MAMSPDPPQSARVWLRQTSGDGVYIVGLASQTMDIHGWGPEEARSPEL